MTFHLAQINIGRLVAPIDDPRIADFVSQLDPINALAVASPGFVWRLQSAAGNATDIVYNDDPFVIVNMSVWESVETLRDFVLQLAPPRRVSRPREMVRENGQAALLLVVDSRRPCSERRGRPGAPGTLSTKWPYAVFLLVLEAFHDANGTKCLVLAERVVPGGL